MQKVLCLGNEFIQEDSFAKKIANELAKEMKETDFIFIKDSFQLMELLYYGKTNSNLKVGEIASQSSVFPSSPNPKQTPHFSVEYKSKGFGDNNKKFVILDVVEGLNKTKLLSVEDLKDIRIMSCHDFDAGFVLKILGKKIKIIGIPQKGDINRIKEEVKGFLGFKKDKV